MSQPDNHGGTADEQKETLSATVGLTRLKMFLEVEDPEMRRAAAEMLADREQTEHSEVREVATLLVDLLDDEPSIRARACAALARVSSQPPQALLDATDLLVARLEDDSPIRRYAIGTIRGVATAEPDAVLNAVEPVAKRLDDQPSVQQHAAATLAAIAEHRPGAIAPVHSELVDALDADSVEVRRFAARALASVAQIEPTAASASFETLRESLDDEDSAVRKHVTEAVAAVVDHEPAQDDDVIETLAERLDEGGDTAVAAIDALESIAEHDSSACRSVVTELLDGLLGETEEVRQRSAAIIAKVAETNPAAVRPAVTGLGRALTDPETTTRRSATAALASIAEHDPGAVKSAVEQLCMLFEDEPEIASAAMGAVTAVVTARPGVGISLIDRLEAQLDADGRAMRVGAARSIAAVARHEPGAVSPIADSLTDHLADDEDTVRENVTSALVAVLLDAPGQNEAVHDVLNQLEAGDSWQQGYAAATLAQLYSPPDDETGPAFSVLLNRIDDDREQIRTAASHDLALLGVEEPMTLGSGVDELADRLDHEDTTVRTNLTHALAALAEADPDAVGPALPALFGRLDDEDETVRRNVLRAFEAIAPDNTGDDCRPTIELLGQTLKSGNPEQRIAAFKALRLVPPVSSTESNLVVSGLLACLEDTHEVRETAISTLAEVETTFDDVHSPLSVLVTEYCASNDRSGALARRAIVELAAHAPTVVREVTPELANLLTSTHDATRQAGWRAMAHIAAEIEHGRSPVALLLSRLDEAGPEQHQVYVRTLVRLGIDVPELLQRDAPALVERLGRADEEREREHLVLALCAAMLDTDGTATPDAETDDTDENGPEPVSSVLADRKHAIPGTVQRAAGMVIGGELPPENLRREWLSEMTDQLHAGQVEHRIYAVLGLGGLALEADRTATVVSDLADRLDDPHPLVGATAARTLSVLAEQDPDDVERILPTLRRYVDDDSTAISQHVLETIATITADTDAQPSGSLLGPGVEQTEPLHEAIVERTTDPSPEIRAAAVRALETLGAPGVLPQIAALEADPVPEVRRAATTAVDTLQQETDAARTPDDETADTEEESVPIGPEPETDDETAVDDDSTGVQPEAAIWPTPRGDPTNSGWVTAAGPDAAPGTEAVEIDTDVVTPAVTTAETVFVGCADNTVRALDPGDTTETDERWRASIDAALVGGPILVDGAVVVADDDGRLHAFEADSGERRWRFAVAGRVASGPTVKDETVVFSTSAGVVCALRATDGSRDWETTVDDATLSSCPAVTDEHVFVVDENGGVLALDREDGAPVWRTALSGESHTAPVCTDGFVIVTSTDHGVYCLDAETGDRRWRFDTGGPILVTPVTDGERVCVASSDESIYALDVSSGTELWRVEHTPVSTEPVLADETLFAPRNDGTLAALDAATGAEHWTITLPNDIETLAVVGDRYWARSNGALLTTGDEQTAWHSHLSHRLIEGMRMIRQKTDRPGSLRQGSSKPL